MNDRNFFTFSFSFLTTIAIAYKFIVPIHGESLFTNKPALIILLGLVVVFVGVFVFFKSQEANPKKQRNTTIQKTRHLSGFDNWNFFVPWSVLLGISIALLLVSVFEYQHKSPNPPVGTNVSFSGVVTTVRASNPGQTVRMRVCQSESCTDRSAYLVEVKSFSGNRLSVGDIAYITGKTSKVEAFDTGNGIMFDYPRYLWKDAVAYRVSAKTVELHSVLKTPMFWLKRILWNMHVGLVKSVKQIVSWKSSPILSGIIIGDGTLIDKDTNTQFRQLGLSHILVLSGFNMTIVASVIFLLFRRTSLRKRACMTMIALVLFLFLAGISPPAVRAVFMVGLFLIIRATGRIGNESRVLLISALIMTAINPRILLYDISFQLSFVATAGLMYISPLLQNLFPKWLPLRGILSETLGAQIAVTPLVLSLSGLFSPYSLILNLIVVPFVPATMLFGGIGMFGWFIWPTLGTIIAYPADIMIRGMLWLVQFVGARVPGSVVSLFAPTTGELFIMYGSLACIIWFVWYKQPDSNKDRVGDTLFA